MCKCNYHTMSSCIVIACISDVMFLSVLTHGNLSRLCVVWPSRLASPAPFAPVQWDGNFTFYTRFVAPHAYCYDISICGTQNITIVYRSELVSSYYNFIHDIAHSDVRLANVCIDIIGTVRPGVKLSKGRVWSRDYDTRCFLLFVSLYGQHPLSTQPLPPSCLTSPALLKLLVRLLLNTVTHHPFVCCHVRAFVRVVGGTHWLSGIKLCRTQTLVHSDRHCFASCWLGAPTGSLIK